MKKGAHMKNHDRLEMLDKHRMCHKCEKAKQLPNRKYCASCLEKITLDNIKRYDPVKAHDYQARRRELYKEHKDNGICVRCSKPATNGLYCIDHAIAAKRHSAAIAQKRKRERHERGLINEFREKNNLCIYCGKAIEDAQHHGRACNSCAEKMSTYSQMGDKTYWKAWRNALWEGMRKK